MAKKDLGKPNLTENALTVLKKRYFKKNDKGEPVETAEELFSRVAENIAGADYLYDKKADVKKTEAEFYGLMTSLDFLPNSPTLMNAGRDLQQLAACFVLPVEDSIEGIFEAIKNAALIHKSGGGTGFSFSRLRPNRDKVKTTSGISSGPVSFMKVFNAATEAVKQGGTRRGANMGILRVDHPDIREFITCKADDKEITNFNISVALTEKFMDAVKDGKKYKLINPRSKEVIAEEDAREIFNLIVEYAWKNGDPGIVFIDRINKDNPTPQVGEIESTNPCVTGDTLVSTEKGLMRIKDIVNNYGNGGLGVIVDEIVVSENNGNVSVATRSKCAVSNISKAFYSGVKPVFEIITESGLKLEATADHKIYTQRGWVRTESIIIGIDKVYVHPEAVCSGNKIKKPEDYRVAVEETVINREYSGEKEVYDLTEPATHSFIANGMVISNCGEQPLLPYEACNLGSINLAQMVKDGRVDYERMKKAIHSAVHFLDNVIDVSKYPLKKIEDMVRSNRKIGLGVMGWADMLLQMDIPYSSDEAIKLAGEVMKFVHGEAEEASLKLAEARGVFPNFAGSVHEKRGKKLRNATLTTIAPTGTLSMIAACSSGVEPLFAVAYTKTVMDNDKLPEINRFFLERARKEGFYSDELMMKIGETGHVTEMPQVPEPVKKTFVTAHDIAPEWHVKMQAAFQKYTDNAVSKTVNFNNDATIEDVKRVYEMAYETGCKGVTIYRDGSRDAQVLTVSVNDKKGGKAVKVVQPEHHEIEPRKRPSVTYGQTIKMKTGCGNLYVTINEDADGLCEVFAAMGKAGGCAAAQSEAISRLLSTALRAGVRPESITKHLRGTRCPAPAWQEGGIVLSCPDAIGIAMEKYLHDKAGNKEKFIFKETAGQKMLGETCPECGTTLEHEGGCNVCRVCGYSKCL